MQIGPGAIFRRNLRVDSGSVQLHQLAASHNRGLNRPQTDLGYPSRLNRRGDGALILPPVGWL